MQLLQPPLSALEWTPASTSRSCAKTVSAFTDLSFLIFHSFSRRGFHRASHAVLNHKLLLPQPFRRRGFVTARRADPAAPSAAAAGGADQRLHRVPWPGGGVPWRAGTEPAPLSRGRPSRQ